MKMAVASVARRMAAVLQVVVLPLHGFLLRVLPAQVS